MDHKALIRRGGIMITLALAWSAILVAPLRAEMRVTSEDALKAVVKKVPPEYPAIAKQMRVSGKVTVDVTVDNDGSVADVKVTSGNALLTPAVVNALKKWKFNPFAGTSGEPTKVVAAIDIDFKM